MTRYIFLIAAIALTLFILPASAEKPVSRYNAIPKPVPLDFNQCVRVFWTDKGRENGINGRISEWKPPLNHDVPALLEYYRREDWGRLVLCDDKAT